MIKTLFTMICTGLVWAGLYHEVWFAQAIFTAVFGLALLVAVGICLYKDHLSQEDKEEMLSTMNKNMRWKSLVATPVITVGYVYILVSTESYNLLGLYATYMISFYGVWYSLYKSVKSGG